MASNKNIERKLKEVLQNNKNSGKLKVEEIKSEFGKLSNTSVDTSEEEVSIIVEDGNKVRDLDFEQFVDNGNLSKSSSNQTTNNGFTEYLVDADVPQVNISDNTTQTVTEVSNLFTAPDSDPTIGRVKSINKEAETVVVGDFSDPFKVFNIDLVNNETTFVAEGNQRIDDAIVDKNNKILTSESVDDNLTLHLYNYDNSTLTEEDSVFVTSFSEIRNLASPVDEEIAFSTNKIIDYSGGNISLSDSPIRGVSANGELRYDEDNEEIYTTDSSGDDGIYIYDVSDRDNIKTVANIDPADNEEFDQSFDLRNFNIIEKNIIATIGRGFSPSSYIIKLNRENESLEILDSISDLDGGEVKYLDEYQGIVVEKEVDNAFSVLYQYGEGEYKEQLKLTVDNPNPASIEDLDENRVLYTDFTNNKLIIDELPDNLGTAIVKKKYRQ